MGEPSSPPSSSDRQENPAPFVLTAEQRANLVPHIDVDALERFLRVAGQSDDERNILLSRFLKQQGRNESFQMIRAVGNDSPRIRLLNALLDEIWAPTWEAWGADAIAESDARLPGRELARARLAARRHASADEHQPPARDDAG